MVVGPKFGLRVADIVTRAVGDHQRRRHPEIVRLIMAAQHAFFELTGAEHRSTSGGLYRALLDTGLAEGWAADTLKFLADGHGQWQTLLAGQATGAAMGGGLLSVIQNELAVPIQGLLESNPHGILAPGDLAIAVSRGVIDWTTGEKDAAKSGLGPESFRRLVVSNQNLPTLSDAMVAYRRGQISEATVDDILARAGFDSEYNFVLKLATELDIDPFRLADLVTFGVLPEDQAAKLAEHSGMSAANFHLLVQGNGMPPSKEELLFAYRRGIIDKARLQRGIIQGPIRNEWFDVIESLGFVPMSTADAIEAAVQGHLSKAEAQKIAGQNGLMADQFEPLFQTAGSPPGAQEMLTLWRRRLMTEAEVRQGLTETRLKPKYVDLILSTKPVLLPMVQIRRAFAAGAMTHARAVDLLGQHGYSAQDADAILAEAKVEKTTKLRHLTEAQIMTLYRDGALDKAHASVMLDALGYGTDETEWLFDLLDLEANQRLVNAAINAIRSKYVGRHITESEAQAALDTLLVPSAQRDQLFAIWDIERDTVRHTLTQAQCSAALKHGLINRGEFEARLSGMGYPDADIAILAALATPAAPTR